VAAQCEAELFGRDYEMLDGWIIAGMSLASRPCYE
jgi:hypothetical protein